jgi:hypothetical protein
MFGQEAPIGNDCLASVRHTVNQVHEIAEGIFHSSLHKISENSCLLVDW